MSQLELIVEFDEEQLTLLIEDVVQHLEDISAEAGNILQREVDGLYVPDTSTDKVDKEVGKSLVDDLEIAKLLSVEEGATKNDTNAALRDRSTHTGEQSISTITNLNSELISKVGKEAGKSLLSNTEIVRLSLIEDGATANRPDTENADKVHSHNIGDVTGLQNSLDGKVDKVVGESLIPDAELLRLATVDTDATKNASDASLRDRSTHTGTQPINTVEGLTDALDSKVDKVFGYSLVADGEIDKLSTVEQDAQKNTVISVAGKQGDVLLDKYDVGLGSVDNTPDADKPLSDAATAALAGKVDKVSSKQLSDENYTLIEKNKLLSIQDGAQVNTVDSVAGKVGVVLLDKADVGLSNVDNTTDINKPISNPTQSALGNKVDKQAGKGLSDTNFTQAEKDKLSYLESSKFVGLFVSESALPLTGSEGDYANVDGGVGSDVYRVIWDSSDNKWVRVQGVSTELTDAQIKQQYESNPDTNAFTDDEKAKLATVANGATANRADILNADKVHTHVINDVTGLSTRLSNIDALIGDVESVLVAINGEP